jgi:hypothetical protein
MALTARESMLPSRAVSGEFHMEHACSGHVRLRMRCPLPYGVESASYLKTGYSRRGFLLKTRCVMLEPPS